MGHDRRGTMKTSDFCANLQVLLTGALGEGVTCGFVPTARGETHLFVNYECTRSDAEILDPDLALTNMRRRSLDALNLVRQEGIPETLSAICTTAYEAKRVPPAIRLHRAVIRPSVVLDRSRQ